MTLSDILNGEKIERTNEAARNGVLLTASNVRHIIADLDNHNKNRNARKSMATIAARNPAGMISPEGIAVWKAYAETF